MAIHIPASFAPKKLSTTLPVGQPLGGRSMNLLSILAILVFFATIGLALSVYVYKSRLVRSIATLDATLLQAKKSFDPKFIAEASRLNARIEAAKGLLQSHRALSPLFNILEGKTLENVRFSDFHFSAERGDEITFGMIGEAKSFNSVALQSDVFGQELAFRDPVFSDFSLNQRGDVIFNFRTTVDPKLLLLRETILNAGGTNTEERGAETSAGDFSGNN